MRRRPPLLLELIASIVLLAPASPLGAASGAGPAEKQPNKTTQETKPLVSVSAMTASDYAACVAELASRKIAFEPVGEASDEGCALSGAVRLAAIATASGNVSLTGKPMMLCSFARQFSAWVSAVAAPLALGYTGQRLAEIETGSAFACRARYDKPGQVPSEHAKGDAVDIAAFMLADGRRLAVKEQASDPPSARDLVRALRTTACGYFTTVLGPGADAAHAEHFHFDTGLHGATPNYRICE